MSAQPVRLQSMRTPLGRVRNLGASHSGTTDFWRQRLTAVAMTLLIVPVIVVVMMLLGRNQAGAAQILGSLPIAIILLLFIVASTWHMKIGMQVVIEDYVHNEKTEARLPSWPTISSRSRWRSPRSTRSSNCLREFNPWP